MPGQYSKSTTCCLYYLPITTSSCSHCCSLIEPNGRLHCEHFHDARYLGTQSDPTGKLPPEFTLDHYGHFSFSVLDGRRAEVRKFGHTIPHRTSPLQYNLPASSLQFQVSPADFMRQAHPRSSTCYLSGRIRNPRSHHLHIC